MTDLEEFLDIQRAAMSHYKLHENKEGIDVQIQLVEQILQLGPDALNNQPRLKMFLQDVTTQLIDAMRWEGMYNNAIVLQERLENYFPESVDVLRMAAANLRIESGQEDVGLAQIRELTEKDPDNLWVWTNLGAGFLWLNRYSESEEAFQHAAGLSHARKIDRAIIHRYLFNLYAAQEGQMIKAQAAWREGCRLDAKMKDLLPEVIRMLIYWREYAEAMKLAAQEPDRVRKLFYEGLAIGEHGNYKDASGYWRTILLEIQFEGLKLGHDEYAEACIRLLNPSLAVTILEPLIQADQVNYFRLVILGLAWAQKQSTERAAWYLSHALRIGDLMRPRKTRPAPQGRILDIHARLLYYDIIINAEVRAELDRYFLPKKTTQG